MRIKEKEEETKDIIITMLVDNFDKFKEEAQDLLADWVMSNRTKGFNFETKEEFIKFCKTPVTKLFSSLFE